LEGRRLLSTFMVDDDGKQCPDADFSSIQAAVDAAAPGDTIEVCPGTYREQVTIDKDNLTLVSEKHWKATILAPAALTDDKVSSRSTPRASSFRDSPSPAPARTFGSASWLIRGAPRRSATITSRISATSPSAAVRTTSLR